MGWAVLDDRGYDHGATAWVIALALVHVVAGAARERADARGAGDPVAVRRVRHRPLRGRTRPLAGRPRTRRRVGRGGGAAAWISRRLESKRALLGSLAFLSLATSIALHIAITDSGYATTIDTRARISALLVAAASALGVAYFLRSERDLPQAPLFLELAAAALVLLALPIAFDGGQLVAAVALGAVALATVAAVWSHAPAGIAALGWAGFALGHVLAVEATPRQALLVGVSTPQAATLGLAIAAVVGVAVLVRDVAGLGRDERTLVLGAAGVTLLYGLSAFVVAAIPAGGGSTDGKGLALSAFWSAVGVGLLIAGLVRDWRTLRIAGIALLSLAIAKVFLYDLAKLGSLTRVGSFLALGVLLLVAAYAYQRQAARREGSS